MNKSITRLKWRTVNLTVVKKICSAFAMLSFRRKRIIFFKYRKNCSLAFIETRFVAFAQKIFSVFLLFKNLNIYCKRCKEKVLFCNELIVKRFINFWPTWSKSEFRSYFQSLIKIHLSVLPDYKKLVWSFLNVKVNECQKVSVGHRSE